MGAEIFPLRKIATEVNHLVNALTFPLLRKTVSHIQKISNYQEYVWYLSNMKAEGEVKGVTKELTLDITHKTGEKRKFELEGIKNG